MTHKNIFISVLIIVNHFCFAQNLPSIQTDRPDQTECPFITPRYFLQFENGFTFEKTAQHQEDFASPSILTRFGLTENFELRLITEYVTNKTELGNNSGIYPILIGFKTKLADEKGIIPTTAFIGHLSIPRLASNGFQQKYFIPEFRFTMQHTLSHKQTLSYNLGAEWNGETPEPSFIYTLTSGYALTKNTGAYLEFYGYMPQNDKPDHRFDGGLTYLINPNHQIDFSAGVGLSKTSPSYFISIGYSFRFQVYN